VNPPAPSAHRPRFKINLGVVATALIVVALDQATKTIVSQTLGQPGQPHSIQVVGDFVRLSYTTNTGAAFGMFPAFTIFFTVVSLLATPVILFARNWVREDAWWMTIVFGLMLGGAVGNLLDRARVGRVTDFIDVGVGNLRWWSFNVADASFVVGVILLAVYLSFTSEETSERRDDVPDPA
jgi:signal peptidase II